jgi:hypothetical protein
MQGFVAKYTEQTHERRRGTQEPSLTRRTHLHFIADLIFRLRSRLCIGGLRASSGNHTDPFQRDDYW